MHTISQEGSGRSRFDGQTEFHAVATGLLRTDEPRSVFEAAEMRPSWAVQHYECEVNVSPSLEEVLTILTRLLSLSSRPRGVRTAGLGASGTITVSAS